jgi:HPt (histidine-containing phosphotransfer) domain-containing protein
MSDFDQAMVKLRERFIGRACEDLTRLRVHGSEPAMSVVELRLCAHRLAGSAGIFGFRRLSEIAGQLDLQLQQGKSDPLLIRALVLELETAMSATPAPAIE